MNWLEMSRLIGDLGHLVSKCPNTSKAVTSGNFTAPISQERGRLRKAPILNTTLLSVIIFVNLHRSVGSGSFLRLGGLANFTTLEMLCKWRRLIRPSQLEPDGSCRTKKKRP